MKGISSRFVVLVGVAGVAGAMYVAAASGSQQSRGPTAPQFAALKKQVASLSKTVKGLKTVVIAETGLLASCDQHAAPINQFGDPSGTFGYHWRQPDGTTEILTTALDASSPSDPNALWFAYGDSSCNLALGGLRHAAGRAGIRLPRRSSHPGFLSAHQR
jgi:hypothetical protein